MTDTNFKLWTLLSLILLIFVASSECAVGDACTFRNTCGFISRFFKCENEHCQCRKSEYLSYDQDTVSEECSSSYVGGIYCLDRCPANSHCNENHTCQCNEGYVKIEHECRKANQQEVLQPCYTANNEAFICNISGHSVCRSGKCICFDKYFPNTTSGQCEHQSSYMKLHGLSEYRVKPGVYCKKDSHCIFGLKCNNFNCSCPSGCTYNSSEEVCDCEEPQVSPVAPIIVGCILAALIIIFWYKKIKTTVQRLQEKKNAQTRLFSTVPDESATQNSYNLYHTRSPSPAISQNTNAHTIPPTGLYANDPSSIAPPGAEPIPAKIEDPNSINLPDITPYPINPTGGTPGHTNQPGATCYPYDSSPPPPYSSIVTDTSLPYSLNPIPVSDPYPSDSCVTPFPSNPSAPPNPVNAYDTPNPSSPHMTPWSPYYETENSTAPPAYNPAYKG